MNQEKIPGGFYLKAKKIQESEIAHWPPHVREIWDWLLLKARHSDGENLKRGQLLTSYKEIREGLHWMVGWRKERYSKWDCEKAMKALTKATMIATRKTTKGLIVTVLNYNYYQNISNYESHNETDRKATRKPQSTDTIEKEVKESKRKELNTLSDFQSNEALETEFYLTRKKRKLTGRRLETFNQFWEAFGYKSGKAEAADAWLDIPTLNCSIVQTIITAAKREAEGRSVIIESGKIPKMAQGWITGRRWEDEIINKNLQPDSSYKGLRDWS